MRWIQTISLCAILMACTSSPNYTLETLPSGKQVRVISVTLTRSSNSEPGLVLRYLTDTDLNDRPALEREVDEIWRYFKKEVEKAGYSKGIILADVQTQGLAFAASKGFGFTFRKTSDGQWRRTP
ncbi:MAG: hypothetical protein HXY46_06540 [Syntrophaceae bacterium]|nr:hypothetical protein [Syntrophaceae bacterium]